MKVKTDMVTQKPREVLGTRSWKRKKWLLPWNQERISGLPNILILDVKK
jgi:hypothetical protein